MDKTFNKKSLLIVEDDFLFVLLLKKKLNPLNISICGVADTGKKAIEANLKHHPDLILMDVKLDPSMDGVEAAKEIRKVNKAKIIFMTGYAIEGVKAMARDQQLKDVYFLEKPVDLVELKRIIEE